MSQYVTIAAVLRTPHTHPDLMLLSKAFSVLIPRRMGVVRVIKREQYPHNVMRKMRDSRTKILMTTATKLKNR